VSRTTQAVCPGADELADWVGVVSGHSTSNPRRDPTGMQLIFLGVLSAKRVPRGRVTDLELGWRPTTQCFDTGRLLQCTIDRIATGEAVGIHCAGLWAENVGLRAHRLTAWPQCFLARAPANPRRRRAATPLRGQHGIPTPARRHRAKASPLSVHVERNTDG
jgi:hypothetical protein